MHMQQPGTKRLHVGCMARGCMCQVLDYVHRVHWMAFCAKCCHAMKFMMQNIIE
eukprot:CAMPEP_0202890488 /NCGR_PEP_ID=MMETSP1392-20130828/871_1 /ASSEMBLY_ACC=CAM_ASM_000868 /TAXON_ID=225041 /ORGANISM="Chlamydomonas chlamydogama, Strain SAG 11-48b" /LENGTH=53 /DNA_ID=CAMNT_0049574065 /DNA_START=434 /DNA_END=598 /DNA_ORIENTATION=-